MPELQLKRLCFSKDADTWLRVLKSRTGITPNLLCRLGFCISLEEPGVPSVDQYPEDSDREINRFTLLGEYDALFVALLRQRIAKDGAPTEESLDSEFRAHMHRGVILLASRIKALAELGDELGRTSQARH
jgi:DNA sulfur modification protein DndE